MAATGLVGWRRAYDESECPGPSSNSTSGSPSSTVARHSAKRTVLRRWSTQYCGSVACSAVIHVPVRLERYGMRGDESSTLRTASRNSGRIGSSIELCPAAAIGIRVGATSSVVMAACRAVISSTGPATTHSSWALIVASESFGGRTARTSASGSGMASMAAPEPLTRSMRAARLTTRSSAPSSVSTPARWAAAYSPRLCPTKAEGWTPQAIHWRASAMDVRKIAGSDAVVWRSASSSASGDSNGSRSTPWRSRKRTRPSRMVSWNTSNRSSSPAAIPTYCDPPPGNMKATRGGSSGATCVATRLRSLERRAATAVSTSGAVMTRRCENGRRVVASVLAASARLMSG